MPDRDDIEHEIQQHLEDRYDELRARGLSHDAAVRDAADQLRDLTQHLRTLEPHTVAAVPRDDSQPGATTMIGSLWQDARYALRSFAKSPGFAAVIVLTLALGIGANSAIFSVVNAVVLQPLPYPDADRIVVIWGNLHRPNVNQIPGSAGEYVDYRDRSRSFDVVAAYDISGFNLTGPGAPERVEGAIVTPELFALLSARARLGRVLQPEEQRPGRADVAVLGHALWIRRFGGDPRVVGQKILVDGRPTEVVGVMPPAFAFPAASTDLWTPLVLDADALSDNNRGSHGYTVLARVKRTVTLEQAQADLDEVTAAFAIEHPDNYREGFSAQIRPLQQEIVGDAARLLVLLLGAVGLVLLIACANVANLFLARASARQKEIAIRTALGASRGRIVRQLLTESIVLAVIGGCAGLTLGVVGVRAIVSLAPAGIPRIGEVSVDRAVVTATAAISIAAGLLFGLAPALRASRTETIDGLKEYGRAARALVVTEVALSLVLLVAAGLLIHSFARLNGVPPGFDRENLLTFRLALPESRYPTFEKGDAFFAHLFDALGTNPSIRSIAAVDAMPFGGQGGSRTFFIEGRAIERPQDQTEEQLRIVTHAYFRTMMIPLIEGREFTERDTLTSPRVAVVNESFARKHFPDGRAIGARVSFNRSDPRWYEIVGVSGNVKHRSLDAADRAELYVPYRQPLFDGWTVRPMYCVARTAVDPLSVVSAVRGEVARLDREQPISDVRTMDARIGGSLAGRRFTTGLLSAFAGFALALAAIGLYALIAHTVSRRSREIGIRLALGAQPGHVRRMILAQGMTMTATGAAIGVAAAIALTRVMSTLLFDVSSADPTTFTAVAGLLAAVALLACWLPARRATRVDPLAALRAE